MGWSTPDLTRALAVIKLWESDKDNLDYDFFARQVAGGKDYDLGDLRRYCATTSSQIWTP